MTLYNNVFIADDDPEDREIFMEALAAVDGTIQCFSANDGEKAIRVLNTDILEKPDLIFLDMNMPFLTGKQVLEQLKKLEVLRDIPVIMYSTFFNEQDIADIHALGAVHYMIKPTSFEVLVNSLTAVLSRKW